MWGGKLQGGPDGSVWKSHAGWGGQKAITFCLMQMGDEKDNWKVKTLDEILQEKKRRKEQEEKSDTKRMKSSDDRDSKRDSLEEGELRDHRMEITIRNSPYRREDSMEDRGEEDDSLAIKPPQQTSRKEKAHHRKDEKRKEKRRHRSHSAEGGKHIRSKEKEKEREHERRKRHREEQDKIRREWERQKRRELAREHSRRERDRLEQLERQRERERKMREQQQKEQREQKERERRAEERRKEREAKREVLSHHRAMREEHMEKVKSSHRSRSPSRQHREKADLGESRKAVKEEKLEDLLSDLQDISDSERKTTSGESTSESRSGSEEEEETSSEESEEGEEEEEENGTDSEEGTEPSADEVSEEELSEEERENGNHIPVESRFDHDSEESEEEEEEEEEEEIEEGTPHSNAQTEGEYVPDSPPMSPVELKKELPKYLPALQVWLTLAPTRSASFLGALARYRGRRQPVLARDQGRREPVLARYRGRREPVLARYRGQQATFLFALAGEVKTLMIQLLRGVRHLHDNWILHRDLKTSNLLLSHAGILKIGDFGLAREYGSPLKPYTPVVVTLWYRAPELLLGAKVCVLNCQGSRFVFGRCIFGELLTQKPLFPGKSEIDQINKVFKDLGTPSEKIWPGYNELPAIKKMTFTDYPYNNLRKRFGALLSDQGFDLMNKFLTYCPAKRTNAEEALKHEYFHETPLPIEPSMFPTWPAKSEQQRVKRGTSPRPPEGGLGYSHLGDDDLKDTGFHLTTTNQGASAAGPGFSLKF
nr:PREDICTED: cyclin-dependent kinase 11A [Latimeria chalumnae]|eukprot:XP_014349921.1 PREDICTED: cyclin-dependent kinase 11A [Latimeria chalumnae]